MAPMLFNEGHDSPAQVNNTNMVECVFDFSAVAPTALTFDYHMYGAYIAFLAVDVYDGNTWTLDVWKKNGQQQTSSNDPWLTAVVDLTAYTGHDKVTIRFRTANNYWSAADPAIDNISIVRGAQTLPYAESFESGFGAWGQSTDDDFDWTRWSGYTPTTNTGPSGASDGAWYLYVEGHEPPVPYKTAAIECTFNFGTATNPELTFDYHMYGPYIDFLSVDVHNGTAWTSNVWQRLDEQHTSSENAWSNAVVDLTAYAGSSNVTIRFRAKQGEWHAADTAIDNIRVAEPSAAGYSTNITFSVTGGSVTLSWPATHLGWILQSQTNALTKGLATNWVDVAGSASVTSTNFPVNGAPASFFRLRKP